MRASRLLLALPLLTTGCLFFPVTETFRGPDLSGTVTVDGIPVPGVTVTAQTTRSSHTTTTGADGKYQFSQVPIGTVTVSASGLPLMVVLNLPSQQVTLGQGEVTVDFRGYSPLSIAGHVRWEYREGVHVGFPGVSARIDRPPFPVASATSDANGVYRLTNAPGYGQFDVLVDPTAEVEIISGAQWRYKIPYESRSDLTDTAFVAYKSRALLTVNVLVDGQSYNNVVVQLATPIPVTGPPGLYINLPATPLQVAITGFPSSITFDAAVQTVDLVAGSNTVTLRGYTPTGNRPPVATILSPANTAAFYHGTPITLQGSATDLEDGLLTGNALDWFTPGRGSYGRGHTITIDTMPVGQHRIVLRATDRQGSTALTSVDITVLPTTGGRVTGNVTIDNGPGFQVRVDLSTTPPRTTVTDLAGNYAFDNVPTGNYTVTLQPVTCVDFPVTSRAAAITAGSTVVANFTGASIAGCYDYGYGGGYGAGARRRPPPPR